MNLPNKLTLSRIIAVPFVMLALLVDNILQTWNIQSQLIVSVGYYLAFIIFVAASITDLYDGKIARARKIVTPFGSFFDPIADKLLISAVLIFSVNSLSRGCGFLPYGRMSISPQVSWVNIRLSPKWSWLFPCWFIYPLCPVMGNY
jgi:phosphatidylglycerophosphate synthase